MGSVYESYLFQIADFKFQISDCFPQIAQMSADAIFCLLASCSLPLFSRMKPPHPVILPQFRPEAPVETGDALLARTFEVEQARRGRIPIYNMVDYRNRYTRRPVDTSKHRAATNSPSGL